MVKTAVIGATGFTGEKLLEILLNHPKVEVSYISAKVEKSFKFSDEFGRFKGKLDLTCDNLDVKKASCADVIFLSLPHRVSFDFAPYFLKKGKLVIDLSADYRLTDTNVYKAYYGTAHKDKANLKKAVYGLPEFFKNQIKKTKLVANPGCYPTVSILSLAPLVKEGIIDTKDIIIDAKTGVTGAGRHPSLAYHYAHLNQNLKAYKVFGHQHTPEMDQVLGQISGKKISLQFCPHLAPMERGILVTVYAKLKKKISGKKIDFVYKKYYGKAPFVRIKDSLPQVRDVVDTNFCDIGFATIENKIIVVGCIDNLMKGASGQAVQNMNIALNLDEPLGLL